MAVKHSKTTVVKWLLEHGANANAQEESGATPLHHAVIHLRYISTMPAIMLV
jgi:ankyrin repeat protein